QAMQQTSIILRHAIRRDLKVEPMEHFVGWSFQRRPLNNRAHRHDRGWACLHCLAYTGDGQDGADANHRIAGTNHNGLRLGQRLAPSRSRLRLCHPVIDDLLDLFLTAALYQVFLKVEEPCRSTNQARYRLITHGQDTHAEAERLAERGGNLRETLAG